MLFPGHYVLASVVALLFALPAHAQRPEGRSTVLAQAQVVSPALAAVALLSEDDAQGTEAPGRSERPSLHLVLHGIPRAPLGVAMSYRGDTVLVRRLQLDPEPRRISVPARLPSRSTPGGDGTETLVVELVHLGL